MVVRVPTGVGVQCGEAIKSYWKRQTNRPALSGAVSSLAFE